MSRAAFPSGRKSLLLILTLAAAISGGAWWWQRPPPEPVHDGQRLSKWLTSLYRDGTTAFPVDALRAFGPDTVRYLAYLAEHGRHPFYQPIYRNKPRPLPFDRAPDWLRRWLPQKWGGLRTQPPIDESSRALEALESLGAEAAPAIPALARILERESNVEGYANYEHASFVLNGIGPASWPMVERFLEHGNPGVRAAVLSGMEIRVGTAQKPAPEAETAKTLAILFKACEDPEANVRGVASSEIARSCSIRPELFTDSFLDEIIRLLANPCNWMRLSLLFVLEDNGAKGARAIPRLIELLDDQSKDMREQSARALAKVDTVEKLSAARLRRMSREDPVDLCRSAAIHTLEDFGLWTEEDVRGEELLSR